MKHINKEQINLSINSDGVLFAINVQNNEKKKNNYGKTWINSIKYSINYIVNNCTKISNDR